MTLEQIYHIYCKYPRVITDSRAIEKDSMFFALKGANFNGNSFAVFALEQGCAYAIVDEPQEVDDHRLIVVDDVLATLQELARLHRRVLGVPIIAITGTNGKTTTKELVCAVLSMKFRTNATQGNFNNHIGVPLTLLGMDASTEFGVVEMGANHPGEIKVLCEIAEPNYGIVTNVGMAHLEGFGSFDGVKATKKELYDYLAKCDGEVFVNVEDDQLLGLLNKQKTLGYGVADGIFSRGVFIQSDPFMVMEMCSPEGKLYVKTQLFGGYNFYNAMAAVAIGRFFDVSDLDIKRALEQYVPRNNRSQLQKTANNVLFLDAYNANPTSMKAAIDNFANMRFSNKTVILGDMLELGENSANEHQAIVDLLKAKKLDEVFLVGPYFSATNISYGMNCFDCVDALAKVLKQDPLRQRHILIKGSRGIHLENVINLL